MVKPDTEIFFPEGTSSDASGAGVSDPEEGGSITTTGVEGCALRGGEGAAAAAAAGGLVDCELGATPSSVGGLGTGLGSLAPFRFELFGTR